MRMEKPAEDFALFFRHMCNTIVGISTSVLDDLLGAVLKLHRSQRETSVRSKFDVSQLQNPPFTYAGPNICARTYWISQSLQIKHLSTLAMSCTLEYFASQEPNIA